MLLATLCSFWIGLSIKNTKTSFCHVLSVSVMDPGETTVSVFTTATAVTMIRLEEMVAYRSDFWDFRDFVTNGLDRRM